MKRSIIPCALLAALARTAGVDAAPIKLPNQTLTVPDGFEIELVAGPPLVNRPIEADFDEQGRLYVTDSSGSNEKSDKQLVDRPHRVVRLEDTDGDGRFDKSTVFADKLMFPEGALWYQGSLYVGAPPSIWKLTDTDGDGVADQREEWHQGKTLTGCANDLHGPYLGPDGWIYWCKGAFAEQSYPLGNGKTLRSRASHMFRKRPDGSGLEAVMTGGMDNPVEVAFTPGGERFFTTTFVHRPEAGKRDGLVHAIYGGLYGKPNDVLDDHKSTGDLMPVTVLWGAAAPCGLTRYESRLFGPDYQDNLFACLFNLHKVSRHVLLPDGATFRTRDSDFVVSDSADFHPTDVLEDADGSLLVVDTGGWYKLCCPTSQLAKPDVLGAIYRIRRQGAPKLDDPRGRKLSWATLKPAELTGLLGDERPAVRREAIQRLAQCGAESVAALGKTLQKAVSVEARRNAIWALTRIDTSNARQVTRAGLADRDESVRQAAIHSASVWRDAGAVKPLLDLLHGASPANRRAAAEALGRLANPVAIPALFSAFADFGPQDRCHEHSLLFALIELAEPKATQSYLQSENLSVRRAALVALDQMDGGGLKPEQVTPLLASTEPALKQTAFWIVGHHPEWGGAVAGFFRERLGAKSLASAEREDLPRQLGRLARSSSIQELLAGSLQEGSVDARLIALRSMAQAGLKEAPPGWLAGVAHALAQENSDLVRQAVTTAAALSLPKGGHAELSEALLRLARDLKAAPPVRLEALAVVPGGPPALEPALFEFVRANLDPGRPVNTRSAAATVLARARLNAEELSALTESLKSVGPLEMPKLLSAFEKSNDETLGLKLVSALKAAKPAGLRYGLVKPLLTNFPATVQREGEELLSRLNTDAAKERAHLEELLVQLKGGDVRRGQAIFNGAKAACSACHAIGYLGGRVGPDLTSIGQVRTERDLLEAIVYPSSSFVRSYEPMVVVTKAGEEQSGVLRKDAPDEVVLATGPESEVRIPRVEIAQMRPGTVSVMPQGLDEQLTRQELADLVAFLKNTKWGPQ